MGMCGLTYLLYRPPGFYHSVGCPGNMLLRASSLTYFNSLHVVLKAKFVPSSDCELQHEMGPVHILKKNLLQQISKELIIHRYSL